MKPQLFLNRRGSAIPVILFLLVLVLMAFSTIPINRFDTFIIKEGKKKVIEAVKLPRKVIPRVGVQVVKTFDLSREGALKGWEEKIFKGRTSYTIEKDSGISCIRATSNNAASALYCKVKLDPKKNPVISWKWKVSKFPVKSMAESLENQKEDDYAGRVYVIFLAKFFLNSKVIEYVWAENIPAGTNGTSSLSKNIKLIVVRSGPDKKGEWISETRDIISDYRMMFGQMPEHDVGAIAVMTNTDNTQTSAEALYGDITLGYKTEEKSVK